MKETGETGKTGKISDILAPKVPKAPEAPLNRPHDANNSQSVVEFRAITFEFHINQPASFLPTGERTVDIVRQSSKTILNLLANQHSAI